MSDSRSSKQGLLLRQLRLQKFREDGRPWTQEDVAKAAGLSERTIRRIEQGEATGVEAISFYLDALEVEDNKRRSVEDALNPFRKEPSPLEDSERSLIKTRLRNSILQLSPHPCYVMDQYWYVRGFNVYILALHRMGHELLHNPDTWHFIAMKFNPKIAMRKLRGEEWANYYHKGFKKFRDAVTNLPGERYERMLQWLKTHKGFTNFWDKAKYEIEPPFDVAQKTQNVTVCWGDRRLEWNEAGGEITISPYLPKWNRSVWIAKAKPEEGKDSNDVLKELRLDEVARSLGYDPVKKPLFFIEEYLSKSLLQQIGGWTE
jgi:transcriptional regulator with XRE-family HTH domain